MKNFHPKKSFMALALGLAITSLSTSAFADTYKVQVNDTLFKIAQKKVISLTKLLQSNPQIQNPNNIYPGMKVNVPSKQSKAPVSVSQYAAQVANLVNKERAKAGLPALRVDNSLSKMALDKAVDMHKNQYFDHTSPTFGSPFDMMKQYGIRFSYAGENIAMGQQSPQQVMKDWMNSPGHRKNIMSQNYNTIGVAYYKGYWVQEFINNR